MKEYAYRNLRLCTKDCLCLYVCPTGATDTENSVIDTDKCIGCGACAKACPSGAISLVPARMPPQQVKTDEVAVAMKVLAADKVRQEALAKGLAGAARGELSRLAIAIARSCRLTAEDIYREAGYMLPQSSNAHELLKQIALSGDEYATKRAARLMELLPVND